MKNITQEKIIHIISLIENGHTQKEIAKIYSKTVRHITQFTNKYGIKNPNKQQNYVLSETQKQIIIGSLLGDGNIDKYGRMSIKHCLKQNVYVKWKKEKLGNLSKNYKENIRYDARTDKKYYTSELRTCVVKPLMEYHKRWYKPKKVLNVEDFRMIEPIGIAVWFMDDGMKYNNTIKISTDCFSLENVKMMRNILLEKFDILFHIDTYNRLFLKKDEYPKFYDLIKQHILPEFSYKLPERLINKKQG